MLNWYNLDGSGGSRMVSGHELNEIRHLSATFE